MQQQSQNMREMPRYKCHKEVWALKIAGLRPYEPDSADEYDGSQLVQPAEPGYGEFRVSAEFVKQHKPVVGGYFMVYADGYKSYSPAKAFEEGYSPVI